MEINNSLRVLSLYENDHNPPVSEENHEFLTGDSLKPELDRMIENIKSEGTIVLCLDDATVKTVTGLSLEMANRKGMGVRLDALSGVSESQQTTLRVGGMYVDVNKFIMLDARKPYNSQFATLCHETAHMMLMEVFGQQIMTLLDQEPIVELTANALFNRVMPSEDMDKRTVNYLKCYDQFTKQMFYGDNRKKWLDMVDTLTEIIWRDYVN